MRSKQRNSWNSSSATEQKISKTWTTITENKIQDNSYSTVSVFTKTSNPKVIIRSEKINDNWDSFQWKDLNKHKLIKFTCIIIILLIILMTFFLSLKTYNMINELSDYVYLNVQP